jgi:signal transduction histidine kinase
MSNSSRGRRVAPGGLVVAAAGFFLTRSSTAASATTESSLAFLVGDLPFLVAGLALSAFGVALGVSDRGRDHGWTVARWCLLGTVATGLAVAAALLGSRLSGSVVEAATGALALDILVAGAVGGTLTGVQVSRRRRHERDLSRRTARLTALNRILRHEVLNGVNVVRGYAGVVSAGPDDRTSANAVAAIERSADRIDEAVREVNALSRRAPTGTVSLSDAAVEAAEAVRDGHPTAAVAVDDPGGDVRVRATGRLAEMLERLIENAVEHGSTTGRSAVDDPVDPRVVVAVRTTGATASVRVEDDGPGLPEPQRRLLADGSLPRYDDPNAGFGLTMVRLLAEEAGATVGVDSRRDGAGTAVEVTFLRERDGDGGSAVDGVSVGGLVDAALAAVLAGVLMGVVFQATQGSIPVIGALYGVMTPLVGWVTHLFHSLVFGVAFVGITNATLARRDRESVPKHALFGAGFGAFLWLFAAGVVMPLWLRTVGIDAPVPSLGLVGLAGHLLWGSVLGGTYAFCCRRR